MCSYSTLKIQLAIENERTMASIVHFIPSQVFLQESVHWKMKMNSKNQSCYPTPFQFFHTRKNYSSGGHCYFIRCFGMKPSWSNIARHLLDKVISNLPSNSQTIRKKRHCQPNLQTYLKCGHRCWSLPCS